MAGEATKKLYLLRHAKSDWDGSDTADFDRPLSAAGEAALPKVRAHMTSAGIRPALVLCSAAARTRQTLAGVQPALADSAEVSVEQELYLASAAWLMGRLRKVAPAVTAVMAIGHNPGIQQLALALMGTGDRQAAQRMAAKFPTAGLAVLALTDGGWAELGEGCCELESFTVPADL